MQWVSESPARWDGDKQRIVGGAAGVFDVPHRQPGEIVPGEWWRLVDDGKTVGYGWMDIVWGDGEILLAVDPDRRGQGLGAAILGHLETEARKRGLNVIYNTVRATHPNRERVTAWLQSHGFEQAHDDERLSRRVHRD